MRQVWVFGLLAGASLAAHADDNCEPLRAKIEAQIAGTGVTGFSVRTLDVNAEAPGEQVGICANGTKKIVYARAAGAAAVAPAARPSVPAKRKADDILTECKDGSISRGGDCKP
jgi:hypothetical protein